VKPRVGLIHRLADPRTEELLAQTAEVCYALSSDAADIGMLLRDVDAVIAHGRVRLTGEQILGATRLRAIGVTGSGTDNVDVEAARRRGIPVVSGAGVAIPTQAVAEYVIGAMVIGQRRLTHAHTLLSTTTMDWSQRFSTLQLRGNQLGNTTLGLVGFGHIGREVAKKAQAAFNNTILVHDPYLTTLDDPTITQIDTLDELLDQSQTVSIHTPLLPSTRGLISHDQLRRIGPHGLLINAARGGIVDETALINALTTGQLGAAVLDVLDNEPPTQTQLARLTQTPNLTITPHIAGQTHQANAAREHNAVQQIIAILEGRPARLANPAVTG
jgi:phosphoglycerate dehydrogenase-like enzyme